MQLFISYSSLYMLGVINPPPSPLRAYVVQIPLQARELP